MKISILTPTTVARKAFWPWVWREVMRQVALSVYALEWVVVVDDRAAFLQFLRENEPKSEAPGVIRVLQEDSPLIGAKRRDALISANGNLVTWFDDDDWHCSDYLKEALHELEGLPPGFGVFLPGAFYVDLETGKGEILRTHAREPMPVSYVGPRDLAMLPFRQHYSQVNMIVKAQTGEDGIWFRSLPRERYAISPTRAYRWAALAHARSATTDQKRGWRYTLGHDHVARFLGEGWSDSQQAISELRSRLGMRSVPYGHY